MMARQKYQRLFRMAKKLKTNYNNDTTLTTEEHMPRLRLNTSEFQILKMLSQENAAEIRHLRGALETRIGGLEAKLEARIGGLETRIGGLEAKLETRIGGLEAKMDKGFESMAASQRHWQMLWLGAVGIAAGLYGVKDKDMILPQTPFLKNNTIKDNSSKAPSPPDLER